MFIIYEVGRGTERRDRVCNRVEKDVGSQPCLLSFYFCCLTGVKVRAYLEDVLVCLFIGR